MAVLSSLPHADKPAVPEDGDRAEHGDGGATQPAQVNKPVEQATVSHKWQTAFCGVICSNYSFPSPAVDKPRLN